MKKLLILASLALGIATLSAPVSARNYDCSKAGNANKAACKSPVAATVASHKTTKVTTVSTTARTYDCTKAGNKTKAACRTATAQTSSGPGVVRTKTVASATYDCTKFINKMRAVCRTQRASATTTGPTMAPSSPVSRPTAARSSTVARSVNSDSAGATAQCKDGSYSHSKHHSGSCSRHGGVAKFLS
jgi:hypothetical protein